MSTSLLARIYEAKSNKIEADLYRKQLLPGIEGTSIDLASLIQDCNVINRLSRMWPDQAAEEAELTFQPCFSEFDDSVPWNE